MDKDTIKADLELLSSDDLLSMWNSYDLEKYKREAFPVIREILTERGIDVPQQNLVSFMKSDQRQLVSCTACGKEIGERANICIHCGTDQRNFFMRHKIITFFLVMFVIGTINRATGNMTTSTSTTKASTPEVTTPKSTITEQPIQITAKQLEQEYDDNLFAADEKYKGKLVEVVGVPIAIDRDFNKKPYLNLAAQASGHSMTNVWCRFNEDNASSLAKVDKGHEVTVQGICDGLDGDVNLKNCKVISISKEPIPPNESKSMLYQYYESQK